MVKLLIFIVLLIAIYAFWKIILKIKINEAFQQSRNEIADLIEDEQPQYIPKVQNKVFEVAAYEQQLFDDIATILLESDTHEMSKEHAIELQETVLRKMPLKTDTNIRNLDLEEWSIYWGFYHQSLEYYVGRYGVFITHVDRNGNEHQYTYRISDEP
jgi:hypothetical protein